MASSRAIQKTEGGSLAQHQDPIRGLTVRFPADRFNVLAPVVHMDRTPPGTRIMVTEVRVDTDKSAKQVFPIAGGDLMLGKVVLDRFCQAAGISWDSVRRIDDGRHPHYYQLEVKGHMTDFDGTIRHLTDAKAIDLREDAGGGIPGKDYEEIVSKNSKPERQLREARKFIHEIAISKAKNRAISGGLGIKRSYTHKELQKPFIIPRLALDPNDASSCELIKANAAGATSALFGARQKVIDATFEEESAPEDLPVHEPAGDEGDAAHPPEVASPSDTAHDENGEVVGDRETLDLVKSAWARAQAAGMKPAAFKQLCETATGKVRKEQMTLSEARAVMRAVEAFVANADAFEDDGMPV